MTNLTTFGLILLSFIFVISSCTPTGIYPIPEADTEILKGEVCFLNYSTKVAEIQFSGEKDTHEIRSQEHICFQRFPGRYTYDLKMGRKTTKNLTVDFKKDSIIKVPLTFAR